MQVPYFLGKQTEQYRVHFISESVFISWSYNETRYNIDISNIISLGNSCNKRGNGLQTQEVK